jgi:hypothetical protein
MSFPFFAFSLSFFVAKLFADYSLLRSNVNAFFVVFILYYFLRGLLAALTLTRDTRSAREVDRVCD